MAEKTIAACGHCGRKPKAGLREVSAVLVEEVVGISITQRFDRQANLCRSCCDHVCRLMVRGFTAKQQTSAGGVDGHAALDDGADFDPLSELNADVDLAKKGI